MSNLETRIAEVLAGHEPNGDAEWCTGEGCKHEFGGDGYVPEETHWEAFARHQSELIAAAWAPVISEAKAEAIREAAGTIQVNTWADLFEGTMQLRVGNSQRVVDWLNSRADELAS